VSRYRLSNKYKKISLLNIKPQKLIKLNQDILNILKSDSNLILAGGALRTIIDANDEIIDYDIFFNSHCDIKTIIEKFKNIGFTVYWECPKGELFNLRNKNNEKVHAEPRRCDPLFFRLEEIRCRNDFQFVRHWNDHYVQANKKNEKRWEYLQKALLHKMRPLVLRRGSVFFAALS
jgi:hypothetical protein